MPKKSMNAFTFFMMDLREKMKAQGQILPTMAKMPSVASPSWNRMTPEEKAPYEAKLREYRRQRTVLGHSLPVDSGKFTADGMSIDQMRREEAMVHEDVSAKESAIRSLVSVMQSEEEISQTSIFLISFNVLVGTLEGKYLPNEIGIVEYSIERGIKNEYHTFINAGPIPVGYTGTAKSFSEEFHAIPIAEFKLASTDYKAIYHSVKSMLQLFDNNETRFVFCKEGEVEQFQICLDWLRDVAGYGNDDEEIILADLAVLVEAMRLYVKEPFSFRSEITDALESNSYDYSSNSRCNFHEDLDNKYCALGYCKKLAYILSDHLCKPFNVTPTQKHLPERPETIKSVVWRPKGPIRPIVNKINVPPKPITEHVPSTIQKNGKSQFVKDSWSSITPSAQLNPMVPENNIVLDDDNMFPSLFGQMGEMSLSSSQKVETPVSWAQMSSRNLPSASQSPLVGSSNPRAPGIGRGVGLGRGRASPKYK